MHRQLLRRPLTKENVVPPIRSVTIPARKPTVPQLKPTPQASGVKVIAGPTMISTNAVKGIDETVEVPTARAKRFEQWVKEHGVGGMDVTADALGPQGTGVAAYHVQVSRIGWQALSDSELQLSRGLMTAIDGFK
jgi:hypothetical protein